MFPYIKYPIQPLKPDATRKHGPNLVVNHRRVSCLQMSGSLFVPAFCTVRTASCWHLSFCSTSLSTCCFCSQTSLSLFHLPGILFDDDANALSFLNILFYTTTNLSLILFKEEESFEFVCFCCSKNWGAFLLIVAATMERYEVVKDIGSGNFGVARLVKDKCTEELFAVKFIERGLKV